jgi:hypothetical protein
MYCLIIFFVKDECCGKCVQCFEEEFFTSLPRHAIIQTRIIIDNVTNNIIPMYECLFIVGLVNVEQLYVFFLKS